MTQDSATRAHGAVPAPQGAQDVLWVRHWDDRLFSFAIGRPPSFRFRSGEFVMIGLPDAHRPVMRAYSIASPHFADELEFLSIKVEGGALTSRLRDIQPGDHVLLGKKPTGTLVLDALKPGKRLFLLRHSSAFCATQRLMTHTSRLFWFIACAAPPSWPIASS
jgi:ferredoxin--NADP+ reductase